MAAIPAVQTAEMMTNATKGSWVHSVHTERSMAAIGFADKRHTWKRTANMPAKREIARPSSTAA